MNKTNKGQTLIVSKIQRIIFKLNNKKLYKCGAFKFTKREYNINLRIALTIYSCLTFKLNINLIFKRKFQLFILFCVFISNAIFNCTLHSLVSHKVAYLLAFLWSLKNKQCMPSHRALSSIFPKRVSKRSPFQVFRPSPRSVKSNPPN